MVYPPKLSEKYMPFLCRISNFEVSSQKNYKTATSSFISFTFSFKLAFKSGYIIFQAFLELHSTLSEKIFLSQMFIF